MACSKFAAAAPTGMPMHASAQMARVQRVRRSVAGRIRKLERFIVVERVLRLRITRGKRPLRNGLKICDARVAPPRGLLLLDSQERSDLAMTLAIHERRELVPRLAHLAHGVCAARIAMHELVPQRASGLRAMVPGRVID